MTKPDKRSFSFEFKLEVVQRFLAGETKVELDREFNLSFTEGDREVGAEISRRGRGRVRPKTGASQAERPPAKFRRIRAERTEVELVTAKYLSLDALATALHEYIRWYNNARISKKVDGLSPVQYRAQAIEA